MDLYFEIVRRSLAHICTDKLSVVINSGKPSTLNDWSSTDKAILNGKA
jgi:hypothetical protein